MILLLQFVLRLVFGLAAGMALTSPKQVTSGYFRNHLYVTLGLAMLAALVSRTAAATAFWPAMLAAGASYVGAVCWLYEKWRAGVFSLLLVAGLALLAIGLSLPGVSFSNSPPDGMPLVPVDHGLEVGLSFAGEAAATIASQPNTSLQKSALELKERDTDRWPFQVVAAVSSGLLLGFTMAAMLLGHWYLNSPTMELAPLRKLILAMATAVVLQGIVSAAGLWANVNLGYPFSTEWILFLLIRWLFGLVGVSLLCWMAWQTLKIPNTQSATGILYVAVIGTFVGETMALLLSSESPFPL